ncbi:MAG: BtrH N-terminal domain-containing protein [Bacteroidales bacterium]|nr:BtrH N-terminal domain-containing protein [Bacteroidales bacterium]
MKKNLMVENYPHERALHCETGSARNLFRFYGKHFSEAMIFGIGSGIDFIHFPIPLLNNLECPLFRSLTTKVFKNFSKRMGIKYKLLTFRNENKAMEKLDFLLESGIPVGLVVEVLFLPYFREISGDWHFNGHQIVVVGKEGDDYIVSDTEWYLPSDSYNKISSADLKKARFPKDLFALKGAMFYIESFTDTIDMKQAIVKGIKKTCFRMIDNPLPFIGYKGIYYLSKRMRNYIKKYGKMKALESIKWQYTISEVAGTGGSGYRFLYATFIKEAAEYLKDKELSDIAIEMRKVGDNWQQLALDITRYIKSEGANDINVLADIVMSIAPKEEQVFRKLKQWVKKQ